MSDLPLSTQKKLDVIAVYYPHWHNYPKGIEWFGQNWEHGEWYFVRHPAKRFQGQINFIPLSGYYDSANPDDVSTEIALAANAGITVFLYDYYWYNGQVTQQEAIEQGFLKARNRDKLKFALMWCYHERVDAFRPDYGKPKRQLMNLAHTPEEFLGLIDYGISHYFNQPEYWRKDGKLFFSIYNFSYLWDTWGKDDEKVRATLLEARRRVREAGLGELHLNAQGVRPEQTAGMAALGLDSFTDYGFNAYNVPNMRERMEKGEACFDYASIDGPLQAHWQAMSEASPLPYIPVVPTGWDSTLRCRLDEPFPWSKGLDYPYGPTFVNTSDVMLEKFLRDAKAAAEAAPKQPGAVYINAWNEYTEGCWLLPDLRRSDYRLRAVARVFGRHPANEYVYAPILQTWVSNPPNQHATSMPIPDLENVKYGSHERQGMDIWLPKNLEQGQKAPVLICIHGGGWNMGDRLQDIHPWLQPCLANGIAAITASYRLLPDAQDEGIVPPVRACLDDAFALVKFVKDHADEWHLDARRIGLTGGSAGACSALYVSLAEENTLGIWAVLMRSPQTTIDPQEMREWIPNSTYGAHAFGYPDFTDWLKHRDECLPWLEKYSGAGLLRQCPTEKAPRFLHEGAPLPKAGRLPSDPTHAAAFRFRFQELCEQKGIFCVEGSIPAMISLLKQ